MANRTNIRLNRTLLILLGILLACLLTLNTKSLYSADLLSDPTNERIPVIDNPAPKTFFDKIGMISFKNFLKKSHL
ncbi:hypothetical protein SAMN05421640_2722 [Ekhidna lutea]|uniref:Uncharacterized protein n=1 Tax=Ekhidna lutea TaxID=447679 RepID=A0A239KK57_EKHLU|nr:hypothetical protein SAMN05421640_2722 [Ekhidna lutea]